MELKEFKTRIKIKAEPGDVYAALTNPFTIELWSGYAAEMGQEPGSEFTMWDGDITGRILELIPNEKVVQEWYFGEQEEPSVVTIKIFADRANSQIDLVHTNIPADVYDEICEGWTEYYLGAIKDFLDIE
jgi:uncharacterized protein YndB with AHSA1/START domain